MKKFALALVLALGFLQSAQANVISTEVNILNTDPGSVRYVNFAVTTAGVFNIDAEGVDTLGLGYNGDPEIYLFTGSVSLANLIGSDDDSGTGLNALIANINLAVGNYVLAVSEFSFTDAEAVSGINAGSVGTPGPARITIQNAANRLGIVQFEAAAVPEPASLALLGLGLFGLFASRVRKSA